MVKKLRIDNKFAPCPVDTGDELFPNGIFEFNITKMLEYIQNNPDSISLEEIAVSDFSEDFSSINEAYMDSVEISRPLIIAEISPGQYNLIDGNHRMGKARRMGIKSLPAYKLNANQHILFLTSTRAYAAFVKYWNSKV
jgi:hypothetical protein